MAQLRGKSKKIQGYLDWARKSVFGFIQLDPPLSSLMDQGAVKAISRRDQGEGKGRNEH
jgi:hypothetical protein